MPKEKVARWSIAGESVQLHKTSIVMRFTLRNAISVTVVLWAVVVAGMAAVRVISVLNGPRDGETYVYTVRFQLFAFCYLYLLPLLLLLAVVIAAECVMAWRLDRRRAGHRN